jgi:hypothetical protein
MNPNHRPFSVTFIACLYLAVGAVGFVYHLHEALGRPSFQYDDVLIEVTELIAFVAGVFLLYGRNWARWVAVAWIAVHVVFIAFESFRGFAFHLVICILIAWALFEPKASQYFRGERIQES